MQAKVYYSDQHHIRDQHIDPHALIVLTRLREAGFIAYLVGGSVRDLLLGQRPKDFDISTSARPEQVKVLFPSALLIGRRFRLAHVRFGRKILEVSTFRAGEVDDARLIVRDNVWGTPEEDVYRRDFTINGLFYDPSDHKIIDYVGGFQDLEKHLLRTIGEPRTRFHQDPVRMIRALKFQARFGFNIDPTILEALPSCRGEILKSAPARVLEELLRMLESRAAEPFFRLLEEHGFLELLLPEFREATQADGLEPIFAYLHAADCAVKEQERVPIDRSVLVGALLFPIVDAKIRSEYWDLGKSPNFAEVHLLVEKMVDLTLSGGTLPFPKRLRAVVAFILEAQYRLLALTNKPVRRGRFIRHPDYAAALQLLRIRAALHPELLQTYESWFQLERPPQQESRSPERRRRSATPSAGQTNEAPE